jgi:hypothetical protein
MSFFKMQEKTKKGWLRIQRWEIHHKKEVMNVLKESTRDPADGGVTALGGYLSGKQERKESSV